MSIVLGTSLLNIMLAILSAYLTDGTEHGGLLVYINCPGQKVVSTYTPS